MKKTLHLLTLILMVILFSFSASAYTWLSENFDFDNEYTSNGWTWTDTSIPSERVDSPINSIYSGYAFGRDQTDSSGNQNWNIQYGYNPNLPNVTSGTMTIKYNLSSRFNNGGGIAYQMLLRGIGSGATIATHITYWNNTHYKVTVPDTYDADNCTWGFLAHNFTASPVLTIDLTNLQYSLYINGSYGSCLNVPIDSATNDRGISRITLADQWADGSNPLFYLDNLNIEITNSGAGGTNESGDDLISCSLPKIFCDNFNYDTALSQKTSYAWKVYNQDLSLDTYFTPQDNEMQLYSTSYKKPQQENPKFRAAYTISAWEEVFYTDRSPIFSHEFDIYPIENNFTYEIRDSSDRYSFKLIGKGDNQSYLNLTYLNSTDDERLICINCLSYNTWNSIKVIVYYHDYAHDYYNDTFGTSQVQVAANNGSIDGIYGNFRFYNNLSVNSKTSNFVKNAKDRYYIDDYYVYIGTDPTITNTHEFYEDLYIPPEPTQYPNVTTPSEAEEGETEDLFSSLENFWPTMGIKSFASRAIVALFLMVILAVLVFGLSTSYGVQTSPLVYLTLEFFLMLLLTYIRLLDWWIPLVVTLLGIGGMFLAYRSQ